MAFLGIIMMVGVLTGTFQRCCLVVFPGVCFHRNSYSGKLLGNLDYTGVARKDIVCCTSWGAAGFKACAFNAYWTIILVFN